MAEIQKALHRKVHSDEQREHARLAILRLPDVTKRVGLKRSSIYAKCATGGFPTPISLSSGGAVGWLESEIDDWIKGRVAASRKAV